MNKARTRWLTTTAATLVALAGSGAPSLAQEPAKAPAAPGEAAKDEHAQYEQPLSPARRGSARAGAPGVEQYYSQQSGDTRYELSIREGELSARINGQRVPEERIRRSGNRVELLDGSGKVVATFNVTGGEMRGRASRRGPDAVVPRVPGAPPQPPEAPEPPEAVRAEPPPVMMGITMGEPADSLLEHLGLKEGEAVLVDRVVEGLPAARAGLKSKDIIVEFDGVRPVTGATVRESLKGKKAGDKVAVKVLRRGQEQALTIELEKFDPAKVAGGGGWAAGAEGQARVDAERAAEQARRLRELGRGQNFRQMDPEEFNRAFREGFDPEQWRQQFEQGFRGFGQDGPRVWMFGPDGRWQGLDGGDEQKRLDELRANLDQRLSELNQKMSRLNEQLSKLQQQLDERAKQQNNPR